MGHGYSQHEVGLAHAEVAKALLKGDLVRPDECSKCHNVSKNTVGRGRIEGHHHKGYHKSNRLKVQWLCTTCHAKEHAKTSPTTGAWLKSQDPNIVLQADKNLFDKGLHRVRREIKYGFPRPLNADMAILWARIDGHVGRVCKEVDNIQKDDWVDELDKDLC